LLLRCMYILQRLDLRSTIPCLEVKDQSRDSPFSQLDTRVQNHIQLHYISFPALSSSRVSLDNISSCNTMYIKHVGLFFDPRRIGNMQCKHIQKSKSHFQPRAHAHVHLHPCNVYASSSPLTPTINRSRRPRLLHPQHAKQHFIHRHKSIEKPTPRPWNQDRHRCHHSIRGIMTRSRNHSNGGKRSIH